MKQALNYSLKVWLTSVIVAPVLLLILALFRRIDPGFVMLPIEWILGAMFSLPSFLLLYILCKCLLKLQSKAIKTKGILSVVGLLLTYIPFWIIDDYSFLLNRDQLSQPLFIAYGVMIVVGVWSFKLKQSVDEAIEKEG